VREEINSNQTSVSKGVGCMELTSMSTIPVAEDDDLRAVVRKPLPLAPLVPLSSFFPFDWNIVPLGLSYTTLPSSPRAMSIHGISEAGRPALSSPLNIFLLTFWIFFSSMGYNIGNGIGLSPHHSFLIGSHSFPIHRISQVSAVLGSHSQRYN
jgi:hypothetical protein